MNVYIFDFLIEYKIILLWHFNLLFYLLTARTGDNPNHNPLKHVSHIKSQRKTKNLSKKSDK